jgi:hypothetical protein
VGEENSSRGFKVEDRRRFSSSGDPRGEDTVPERAPATPEQSVGVGPTTAPPREDELAEISFSTFVIGLSTQALVHLGEMPDPSSQQMVRDLGGAKQLIDVLGIIETKTRGNLDEAESRLLSNILYDLRMRYVERSRRE